MAKASKARNDKTRARRIEDFRTRNAAAIPAAIIDKRTIRFSVSPRTAGNSPKASNWKTSQRIGNSRRPARILNQTGARPRQKLAAAISLHLTFQMLELYTIFVERSARCLAAWGAQPAVRLPFRPQWTILI
jgi:hypothetical protein